jgi:sugar phosphate isomerase/epimerase
MTPTDSNLTCPNQATKSGSLSRRRFLALTAAAAASFVWGQVSGAETARDPLRLGMMLQGGSTSALLKNAKAVAAAGFDTVQLSFFFDPSAEELRTLAKELQALKLKTVAFGTYINPLQPDNATFMGSTKAAMKQISALADLFSCKQFVIWSGSHSPRFDTPDPRNHTEKAVQTVQQAIRDVVLPLLEPIGGRVAIEPYYRHVLGSIEMAEAIFEPFPADKVGLLADPPNFISPELYPRREAEMSRLFSRLGNRIHLAHFKDLKLDATGNNVDLPAPGLGVMDYREYARQLRRLGRPVYCILEHIAANTEEMASRKAWVEQQLRG